MTPRQEEKSDTQQDQNETITWEFDTIEDHRRTQEGEYEYYIRWKNLPSSQNTWEPANFIDDPQDTAKYWKRYKTKTQLEKQAKKDFKNSRLSYQNKRKRKPKKRTTQLIQPTLHYFVEDSEDGEEQSDGGSLNKNNNKRYNKPKKPRNTKPNKRNKSDNESDEIPLKRKRINKPNNNENVPATLTQNNSTSPPSTTPYPSNNEVHNNTASFPPSTSPDHNLSSRKRKESILIDLDPMDLELPQSDSDEDDEEYKGPYQLQPKYKKHKKPP
jgi:hypothetical protein